MKKKTKRMVRRIGTGAGILGGVVAAGYAARHLRRRSGQETPEEMNRRDAMRAQDFEPGSNFEMMSPRRDDIYSDPSVRTSVGLAIPGEEGVH